MKALLAMLGAGGFLAFMGRGGAEKTTTVTVGSYPYRVSKLPGPNHFRIEAVDGDLVLSSVEFDATEVKGARGGMASLTRMLAAMPVIAASQPFGA